MARNGKNDYEERNQETHSNDLWTRIMRTPAARLKHSIRNLKCSHTEICDLDVHILVEQNILGFEVSVRDIKSIDV